jgi:hypothetical protein
VAGAPEELKDLHLLRDVLEGELSQGSQRELWFIRQMSTLVDGDGKA